MARETGPGPTGQAETGADGGLAWFAEVGGSNRRVLLALLVFFTGLFIAQHFMKNRAASRSQAASTMREVVMAQENYFATLGQGAYASTLLQLEEAGLLNGGSPETRAGYLFSLSSDRGGKTFTLSARPRVYGQTGTHSYYADQTGVVRVTDEDVPATPDDPPL